MKMRRVTTFHVFLSIAFVLGWALCFLGPCGGSRLVAGEKKKTPSPYESRKVKDRVKEFEELGLTSDTEDAVKRGLKWLVAGQQPDGRWKIDDPRWKEMTETSNDTAGTAFGLLPFLAAGYTHRPSKENPYSKTVQKGLNFLIGSQNRTTGNLGGGMYSHALGTVALCEAYGLSRDANLKGPGQAAVDYIVRAQHERGGWRYTPGQAGDTSITGWHLAGALSRNVRITPGAKDL